MLPESEALNIEDKLYVNPQVSLDEQTAFIDNLRNVQNQNSAEINRQTYDLGTAVPSNLGGLTGGEGYFAARYQTPQDASLAANLRATAQAQALNDILAGQVDVMKQRYNNAYRAYQRRRARPSNPTNPNNPGGGGGGVEEEKTGDITGLSAQQDLNQYSNPSTVYDSTEVAHDSRSTERDKKIEVFKDKNGNVTSMSVNGVPTYGREARARYRYAKNAGLVR